VDLAWDLDLDLDLDPDLENLRCHGTRQKLGSERMVPVPVTIPGLATTPTPPGQTSDQSQLRA